MTLSIYCDDHSDKSQTHVSAVELQGGKWRGDGYTPEFDHWQFRCPQCGYNVVARDERMQPVIAAVAAAELPKMSLKGLMYALSK